MSRKSIFIYFRNRHFIIILIFIGLAVLPGFIFSGCGLLKNKADSKKQFIRGVVNGKEEFYKYKPSGIYDTAKHKITLKASDTSAEQSKMWVINVELGKQQTLKTLQYPRTFSTSSDVNQKQVIFANIFLDSNDGGFLYDNYTWRRNSDLVVILESYNKNMLKGRFSGSLSRSGSKVDVTGGYFYLYIVEK